MSRRLSAWRQQHELRGQIDMNSSSRSPFTNCVQDFEPVQVEFLIYKIMLVMIASLGCCKG